MAVLGAIQSAFGSSTDGGVVYLAGGLAAAMAGLAYLALRGAAVSAAARWTLVVVAFGVGAGVGYLTAQG